MWKHGRPATSVFPKYSCVNISGVFFCSNSRFKRLSPRPVISDSESGSTAEEVSLPTEFPNPRYLSRRLYCPDAFPARRTISQNRILRPARRTADICSMHSPPTQSMILTLTSISFFEAFDSTSLPFSATPIIEDASYTSVFRTHIVMKRRAAPAAKYSENNRGR